MSNEEKNKNTQTVGTNGQPTVETDEQQIETNGQQKQQNSGDVNKGMSPAKKYILFGILAALVIGVGIYGWNWWQYSQSHESTDDAHIDGHISPVIPRVDGYVANVYVNDNERVKKGQVLAVIDKSEYQINVKHAEAALVAAKAGYHEAKAHLVVVEAQANRAKVQLNQAKTERNRQRRLFKDHSTTQQRLDNATYAFQSDQANYKMTHGQIKSSRIKIQNAQAQIEKARAVLDNAQLNLSYTALIAPISGRVSKKNIERGQYVRSGNQVMAIAKDSVWVVANFKEKEVAHIQVGQPVSISVDAYSDTTYKGTVQSIAGATGSKFALLPPDNASGNFVKVQQRIPIKIVFNGVDPRGPTGKLLRPGMNCEPAITIKQ
jgi:membrane fusion protein (multidrug efflux system)